MENTAFHKAQFQVLYFLNFVPRVRTDLGQGAVTYADVQKEFKLTEKVTLGELKVLLKDGEDESFNCH